MLLITFVSNKTFGGYRIYRTIIVSRSSLRNVDLKRVRHTVPMLNPSERFEQSFTGNTFDCRDLADIPDSP
jgi:hypothetical protein